MAIKRISFINQFEDEDAAESLIDFAYNYTLKPDPSSLKKLSNTFHASFSNIVSFFSTLSLTNADELKKKLDIAIKNKAISQSLYEKSLAIIKAQFEQIQLLDMQQTYDKEKHWAAIEGGLSIIVDFSFELNVRLLNNVVDKVTS